MTGLVVPGGGNAQCWGRGWMFSASRQDITSFLHYQKSVFKWGCSKKEKEKKTSPSVAANLSLLPLHQAPPLPRVLITSYSSEDFTFTY